MMTIQLFKSWVWPLVLGILFVIAGFTLLAAPVVTTLLTIMFLGSFLVIYGAIYFISSLLDRHSEHFWLYLFLSALTLVVGILILARPTITLLSLTLLLGALFLTIGVFRILASLFSHFQGWGWVLLNGIISIILGLLILMQWPSSSFWIIGIFIGIDLLFAGWALIMGAFLTKKTAKWPAHEITK